MPWPRIGRAMNDTNPALTESQSSAAVFIIVIGAATLATVFYYQYMLGYQPCPLCLDQRKAFYVSIPLAVLLWLGAGHGASRKVMMFGFAAVALAMLWNAGLSAYHAGVEWKLWAGPSDCSGPINGFGTTTDLLKSLQGIHIPRCDQAAWRFLGISFAGYDVLVSLALVIAAGAGLKAARATE
jgi:disulfide bond formation protein DsbB